MTTAPDVARGRRGPRPRFTLDEVLDAAVRIPHRELTMVRLSQSLGMTGSAIYKYLRDKDHLVELLTERLSHALPVPDAALAWDEWLRRASWGVHQLLVTYPLLQDSQAWALLGSSGAALVSRGREVLTAQGFSPLQASQIYTSCTLLAHSLAWAALVAAEHEELRPTGPTVQEMLDAGLDLIIAGAFTWL